MPTTAKSRESQESMFAVIYIVGSQSRESFLTIRTENLAATRDFTHSPCAKHTDACDVDHTLAMHRRATIPLDVPA
jgi:hypothetical protein